MSICALARDTDVGRTRVGATKLGDKGIGRLSAMRLGDRLTVETTTEGETPLERSWTSNWGIFSHSKDMLVQDIEIAPERGSTKRNRNDHGTTIRIRTPERRLDLDSLPRAVGRQRSLGSWIHSRPAPQTDCLIARHNGRRAMIPSIPKALLKHAHAICRATFRFADGHPVIEGKVDYRERQRVNDASKFADRR